MPAPTTGEAFLECVRKSGLVDPEYLRSYVDSLRSEGALPAGPQALARRLVDDGLLTECHIGQMLKGKYRGFLVGKYKVLEPLGAGGMGSVFLAEHTVLGHRVALKLLTGAPEDDAGAVERFFGEARAGSALDHPNLVRAYDLDHDGSYYYLVMDYADGVSLQELVRRDGPLGPARAAHYAAQAARGLAHLHEAGLVHHDVKPANLVLERTGRVRVLDLGLARRLDGEHETLPPDSQKQVICGTADYLAPEQAVAGQGADVRSDVYSLGATLYYLLAGRVPFPGRSAPRKLLAHQSETPEPLTRLRPDIPAGLAAVVEKMMAKRPGERYQTASEVAEALAPWADVPLGPPPAGDFPPPRRPAPMHSLAPTLSRRTPLSRPSPSGLSSSRLAGPALARPSPHSTAPAARPEKPAARPGGTRPSGVPGVWRGWVRPARRWPRWARLAGGAAAPLLALLTALRR